jgi:hypothetical protein
VIAAALVAGVFLLYVATYASIPAGDGYWVLDSIARALAAPPPSILDKDLLINPPSALTHYLFFGLKRLADASGVPIGTLRLIQTVNAVAAGAGAALVYGIVRALGARRTLGALTGGLLAVSFGYWHFANGDLQLLSLVVLLLIFWLIVRARVRGAWSSWFVVGIAVLNAVAGLLRQENVLFGFAAVALLCFGRPWRPALRDALLYVVVGSLGTWTGAVLLAKSRHTVSISGAIHWYLWIFREHVGHQQEFQGFEYATKFDVPRVVKGQLTAFIVGTQAIVDSIRGRTLLSHPKVLALAALTLVAYGSMATLAADLWRVRHLVETRLVAVAVACAVWIVTYKVALHAWLWPTVTKYQVVTVPPLILLMVLGVVAAQTSTGGRRSGWRTGLVAVLVVVVFAVDLGGGVLPWRRYGVMKATLESRRAAEFRPDDLFISSESGIDPIFARLYQAGVAHHVSVKNVFVENPAPEAFASIRAEIGRQLALGRRVFVYNFVPAPYSLIAINQSPMRAGTPLSALDFEAFVDELRKTYAMRPLFSYWEESKAPLYLFGERLEPFWELTARP